MESSGLAAEVDELHLFYGFTQKAAAEGAELHGSVSGEKLDRQRHTFDARRSESEPDGLRGDFGGVDHGGACGGECLEQGAQQRVVGATQQQGVGLE